MHADDTYALRARRVALMEPDAPFVEDGAVLVRHGRVAQAGAWKDLRAALPCPARDLGEVTLLPGLVNAHTHLELSHLGLPPAGVSGYLDWVRWLIAQPLNAAVADHVDAALAAMARAGTAGVADIATRRPGFTAERLDAHGFDYVVQYELFGHAYDDTLPEFPEGVAPDRLALAGHALYSTAPSALRLAKAWDRERGKAFSIHLAEHPGEVELLADGSGAFAEFLRQRVLPKDFRPPGLSPVAWADALGLLDASTLAVHCVHVGAPDIALLAARGATACLCPRSNAVLGVGRAPARALLDAGVPCCLGTDSLASSPDLDLWNELRALLEHCPLPGAQALAMLTRVPAAVLGFRNLGRIAPGAAASFALLPPDLEAALQD